jgi:hypothetical protein
MRTAGKFVTEACPNCMLKEIDPIFLHHDPSKDEFYCLKCGYTGDKREVRMLRKLMRTVRLGTLAVLDGGTR